MRYDPASDSSAKFVGMDVPRGCGCSGYLFLSFIAVIVIASVVNSITKPSPQRQPPTIGSQR